MRKCWMAGFLGVALASSAVAAVPASAHPRPVVPPVVSPAAAFSTSGDYATDVLGDPWDFSNDEDVPPIPGIGCQGNAFTDCNISRDPGGALVVNTHKGTIIKLIRNWDLELPYGRDGEVVPVDAGRYSILSFSMCNGGSGQMNLGVRFYEDGGGFNQIGFFAATGCHQYRIDLAGGGYQEPSGSPWGGKVIRLDIISGGPNSGGDPGVDLSLDWVRLHRPDAADAPPLGVPVARTLTPNADGGADYGSSIGNPWDMSDGGDFVKLNGINASPGGGGLVGQTSGGDPWVEFPLPLTFNPDRYHRFSADLCLDGGMSFAAAPGGGMNARIIWTPDDVSYAETQDIIITPGCQHIAIDLATTPALAVNDETSPFQPGWRGQRVARLRFDIDEDPGVRNFTLKNVKFADDAAFSSSYPITYQDASGAGGTAEIWATTNQTGFDGSKIAQRLPVNGGAVNTFNWNGTDVNGATMPNGSYWIYTVIRNGAGVATGYSSAPVRIERSQGATPSTFVPLSPSRLLDTRDGTGGNIVPLGPNLYTELQVAGRGGVPPTGATAVVLNVTVDHPSEPGVITVWPSGEPQPLVSSLNFNPGDVVANLVTVKMGANGKVNVYNLKGVTPTVVDVVGYYTADPNPSGRYTPLAPGRVLDTGFANEIGPGATIDVQVAGQHGVPATGVTGVALNITVDNPSASSYFTVYPTGEGRPNASTLNFVRGLTVANLTLAKLGANGKVSIWNYDGTARVVADVVGYFSAQGGRFVPVSPQRLVDTRDGTGMPQAQIGPGQTVTVPIVRGGSPVPASATGAVLNVTSAESSAQSFITLFPFGEGRPAEGSTVNPRVGVPVPNHAYVKLGAGNASLFNFAGSTDVVIDVFGYITP
ncbi:MAG: hypothetical protein JWM12_1122 [Ilumatobacteraceae bacterium]|nr:hypothetical protein [Ilumatobacteraceae bacterium]